MNVLFLDIDGVLNSSKFYETHRAEIGRESSMFWRSVAELDPEACAIVNTICEEHDLKIVISSSWRKLHETWKIEAMFHKKGLFADVAGVTPDLGGNWRGNEVKQFIKEHPELNIEKYLIIDDGTDYDVGEPLIKTSHEEGVQPFHIEEAKSFMGRLGKSEPKSL